MHGQAWGFDWGYVGDEVQFVRSNTMELVGGSAKPFITSVAEISVLDAQGSQFEGLHGGREFIIRFADALPTEISANDPLPCHG